MILKDDISFQNNFNDIFPSQIKPNILRVYRQNRATTSVDSCGIVFPFLVIRVKNKLIIQDTFTQPTVMKICTKVVDPKGMFQ